MRRMLPVLVLLSFMVLPGCAGMTPQQKATVKTAAGVLKAVANVPLPPGVDPLAAKEFNDWRKWGGDLVEQLEHVAEDQSPKVPASSGPASPQTALPGSSKAEG